MSATTTQHIFLDKQHPMVWRALNGMGLKVRRADNVGEFRCEYVGRTPLAKGYGQLPMFVVRRTSAPQPA